MVRTESNFVGACLRGGSVFFPFSCEACRNSFTFGGKGLDYYVAHATMA